MRLLRIRKYKPFARGQTASKWNLNHCRLIWAFKRHILLLLLILLISSPSVNQMLSHHPDGPAKNMLSSLFIDEETKAPEGQVMPSTEE